MDQLAGLTEEARKRALARFHILQPHLQDKPPLKSIATAAGTPFRTAQRWVPLYHQSGLAVARMKRNDSGDHRVVSAKIKEAIKRPALQGFAPTRHTVRALTRSITSRRYCRFIRKGIKPYVVPLRAGKTGATIFNRIRVERVFRC